ncbi:hypothetical protein ACFLT1_03120 [Bacteroidota bacterium]
MESNKNQRDIKLLKLYSLILTTLIVILLVKEFNNDKVKLPDIIRAQGIIVEDENGNERILIGAPVPFASNRVRTDTNRVKEEWGNMFPPQYLEWYKEYKHNNYGILILDSLGFDRIAIGNPAPDPNIGKRIGNSTGIIINDQNGFERTGYGVLNVNGQNRVVLGLDNENGSEGIAIALFEDGTSGLSMGSKQGSIFLGKADTTNYYTKKAPFIGLIVRDSSGNEIGLNSNKKK